MSNSSDTASQAFAGIGGGIATKHQDLVASIVFVVAFAAIIPLAIWRLVHPATRSLVIIRPSIFVVVQVLAYAIRAVIANGNQNETLYIISQVFMLAGFVLICEPIPALLSRVIGKHQRGVHGGEHHLQKQILRVLQLALVVALILAVVAATKISSNMSASDVHDLKDYRIANAALVIGAIFGSILVAISFVMHNIITSKGTILLIVQCIFVLAAAFYKLIVALHPASSFSTSGKIVFYIFTPACSWVVAVIYFIPNLQVLFPPQDKIAVAPDVDLSSWQPRGQQPLTTSTLSKEHQSGYMA